MNILKAFIGLILVGIMIASVDAAWISYTTNKGKIVRQRENITQKPQILPSYHKASKLSESSAVEVVKFVDKTETLPGGTITYTIIATNHGTNTITNISLIDAIPSYTTFLDAGGFGTITYCHDGSGANFDNNTQSVTHVRWEVSEILPDGTATFVLKVKVK
jgi:uncharacterized repeat protein (TIGR01451 family)